jgi:ectoine hydroxylase
MIDNSAAKNEFSTFWEQGFIIVRNVFQPAEMQVLRDIIEANARMRAHANRDVVRSGGETRPSFETIFVWNDTFGDDAFAKATRSAKIIDRLENFFGDEVYVYHNKVALKYPGVIGFSYHQDYAYWYEMGNLFPDMATAFVAVDPATCENGCLRLLKGSHKLGRLNHVNYNGAADTGVDLERLSIIKNQFEEVPIELDCGDIVLFHCNMLHASDDNRSQKSRIALLGCYNTKHNNPYKAVGGHPGYQPSEKIRDPITPADAQRLPDFDYQWKPE